MSFVIYGVHLLHPDKRRSMRENLLVFYLPATRLGQVLLFFLKAELVFVRLVMIKVLLRKLGCPWSLIHASKT
jgi:hypothetical protein